MPDWVTADEFEMPYSTDSAEPWTPRPHPFLEFAPTRPTTASARRTTAPARPIVPPTRPVVAQPAAAAPPPPPPRPVAPPPPAAAAPPLPPRPAAPPPPPAAAPVVPQLAPRPLQPPVPPPPVPQPGPVLVPNPPGAPAPRARHPFAEFTSNPPRPVAVPAATAKASPGAGSDVHWSFPAEQDVTQRPDTLRMHMEKAGLNAEELAAALGVAATALNGWLNGSVPVPAWVLPSVSVLGLVTPAARKEARGTAHPEAAPVRKSVSSQTGGRHPFARIEEL